MELIVLGLLRINGRLIRSFKVSNRGKLNPLRNPFALISLFNRSKIGKENLNEGDSTNS